MIHRSRHLTVLSLVALVGCGSGDDGTEGVSNNAAGGTGATDSGGSNASGSIASDQSTSGGTGSAGGGTASGGNGGNTGGGTSSGTGGTASGGSDSSTNGGTGGVTNPDVRVQPTGDTSCELLGSCCAQVDDAVCDNAVERQDVATCYATLERQIANLACGPLITGLVEVTFSSDGVDESFSCSGPENVGLLELAYRADTETITVACRNTVRLNDQLRAELPAVEGVFEGNGPSPPSGTFSFAQPSDERVSFNYPNGQNVSYVANIERFDPDSLHVVGTLTATWFSGLNDAPPVTVTVSFDADLARIPVQPELE